MRTPHKSIVVFAVAVAISVPTFLILNAQAKTSDHIKAYNQSNLPAIPLKQSLPKVIHFSKSASLQLIAYSGATKLTSGKWKSILGTVTSDGSYSFPDQIPPSGFDTITFTDNSGKETSINLAFAPNHPEDFDSGHEPIAPEVHLSRSIMLSPFAQETTRINSSTLHLHASLNSNQLSQNKPTRINPQQINRQMFVLLPSNSSNHQIFTEATQEFSVVEQPLFTVAPKQIMDIKELKQTSSVTVSSPLFYRKLSNPILQIFTHRFSGGQITGNCYQADAVAIQYQDHYKLISGQLSFIGSTVTQTQGHYGFGFTPTNLGATPTQEALGYNLKGYKFDHTDKSNSFQLQL